MRSVSDALRAKLRLAAAVFAECGFDGATIDALSGATGVPSSTLYYNFDGKEQILAFLLQDWLERISSAVDEAVSSRDATPSRLEAVIRAQLEAMAADPATCQVLLTELGRIDRLPAIADAVQAAFHGPVAKLLADGAADGSLRAVDVENATSAVFGAVTFTGLHHVVANPGEVPAFDAGVVAESVVDIVLSGIGVR